MIELNLRERRPVDYTPAVAEKIEEMQTILTAAKNKLAKECPYDLESLLYQLKWPLREATEMVNKAADYYEVASELKPKKEDIILMKPLEPKN